MSAIQDTFFKIQDTKKKQREIRAVYRGALDKSHAHQDVMSQIRALREKKKGIEDRIKAEYSREMDMLDDLSETMRAEQERMADMVVSSLSRGEIIKVRDMRNNAYDPIVKVVFRKIDEQEGV
ncbi:hypothetical protein HY732_05095 [Candidatus Uhrbacteria bacterium]|nr:hypothetical protein [Candidatus Uhrbacteria bacterium]